jgi:hypothetical protein
MIHHIVMWKIKDLAKGHTKSENAGLIKQKLEAMKGQVPGIRKLEVGIKMEASSFANFDVVLDSVFDSFEDLMNYQAHPLHREFMRWISDIRDEKASVDYELELK